MSLATELERHPGIWCGSGLARTGCPGIATGFAALDAELPGGGWPCGALTEILPQHEGIGELRILGPALAQLAAQGKFIAWIAPPYLPYAPALAAAGIGLERVVIVKTAKDGDSLWAAEQVLRSAACGGVLAWPREICFAQLRRLQLAAEGGRCLAVLFRPTQVAHEPSPAALRIALATSAGGLALSILKRRGAPLSRPILLPALSAPLAAAGSRPPPRFDAHVVDSWTLGQLASLPKRHNFSLARPRGCA
jgi:cell division inhibitor SulA/protein ImuA